MILYANGCSMTYGEELGGETIIGGIQPKENNPDFRRKNSWPAILGELLNAKKIVNEAIRGSGNDRIFRTTMEWTSKYLQNNNAEDLFVAIGWSSPERIEYRINNSWINILPQFPPIDKLQNVVELHNFHVNEIMNDQREYTASINYMLALQSWFKINSISYIFFNALHMYWPDIKEIEILRKYIDTNNYYKFDNKDFCMFTYCKKYPSGPRQHPLEEGHQSWANILYERIIRND